MLFSKLYINLSVKDYFLTKKIVSKLRIPFEIVYDESIFLKKIKDHSDHISFGKRILYLTHNKGSFLRRCPGTSHYNCCGYSILHIGSFCTMDCSYCVLQSYFHPPITKFFVNQDKLEKELNILFQSKTVNRVGTGEFTDSLIWEDLTSISCKLIKKFSSQNYSVLELKTKTLNVEKFKKLSHNKKTILSWSINTNQVIENEERYTASLKSRLKAASLCESWGYPLAFHFDPIISYEGCLSDYDQTIEFLFNSISSKNIVWISLGSFRYMPYLKTIIKKRFSSSKIIYDEFVKGLDGKMRYFKSIRIALYSHLIKSIRKIDPNICLYFCMENDSVWKKAMNINLKDGKELKFILDEEAKKKCKLIID